MKSIVFFNNQGGLGNATLVYHMTWMYAALGARVVVADLDPQSNLTSMFLGSERLEEIWLARDHQISIMGAIRPMLNGIDDVDVPHLEPIPGDQPGADRIGLLVGDPGLATFEDKLSDAWVRCLDGDEFSFRVTTSFFRLLVKLSRKHDADLVLISVGPGLGAINRTAGISAHHIVLPVEPDLLSLQCVRHLGTTLRSWRFEWKERIPRKPDPELLLPFGAFESVGYVLFQHARRADGPFQNHERYRARVPSVYRQFVLGMMGTLENVPAVEQDPHCLALLNPYRILGPMAMAARKPMFYLNAADGARGAHERAVRSCYDDFQGLALTIADQCQVMLPGAPDDVVEELR